MKIKLLILVALISLILTTGMACSSNKTTGTLSPDEFVTITYNAAFNGETAAGYLNLVIDMAIENNGFESFNTSPANFSVKVGEFTYKARESQLEEMYLPDGGSIDGKLSFQVPPGAAIPGIGYELTYSGQSAHNVRWIDTSKPSDVASSTDFVPEINIAYSTDLMWVSPPGIQFLEVEPPGNLYLVVEMTIVNRGYESFHTNPDNFFVEVSSVVRSVTAEVEEELIDWRELNIPNGGKYIGSLAFHIPTEVAQSFYKWEYKMMHKGVRSYSIQWTEIKESMCKADPVETKLESVYLRNGDSLSGRLAYEITPELAAENAVYEMYYDEEDLYNVQWFDKPDAVADVDRNAISYPVIKVTYSTSSMRSEESGRLYLAVDVIIENMGYESFLTDPINFFLEVSY